MCNNKLVHKHMHETLPSLKLEGAIAIEQKAIELPPLEYSFDHQVEPVEDDIIDYEPRKAIRRPARSLQIETGRNNTVDIKSHAKPAAFVILPLLIIIVGNREICLAFNLLTMPLNPQTQTKKSLTIAAFQANWNKEQILNALKQKVGAGNQATVGKSGTQFAPSSGPVAGTVQPAADIVKATPWPEQAPCQNTSEQTSETSPSTESKSVYAEQADIDAVNNAIPHQTEALKSVNGYSQVLPGYKFKFPKDHGSHDQYKSEWWYYSGHLKSKDGKTYGFELTFFRLGGDYEAQNPKSAWKGQNYKLAHFALTDENGKKFFVDEKISHGRAGSAGAASDMCYVHNQGWSVSRLGNTFLLEARSPEYGIHLLLDPKKPPVVHGQGGYCQKSARTGEGTLYYSMTRLKTNGILFIGDRPVEVTGLSWMDHEFGSYRLTFEQTGWDWYSIQLDDNRELMLCMIRRLDGTLEPASMGTLVDARGHSKYLHVDQFVSESNGQWHSEKSGGTYPMGWHVWLPGDSLDINMTATVKDQELNTSAPVGITYWEGAVRVQGMSNGKKVTGQGYVEMFGYAECCKQSIF